MIYFFDFLMIKNNKNPGKSYRGFYPLQKVIPKPLLRLPRILPLPHNLPLRRGTEVHR